MHGTKEQIVIDYLLGKIISGEYHKDSRIPSEYRLADKFKINKGTANRAVSHLVSKGYLKRQKGAGGTIVVRNKLFPIYKMAYIGIMGGPHSYYPMLLRGLSEGATENGCLISCFNINLNTNIKRFNDNLQELNSDLLFIGGQLPQIYIPDIPTIFIDTYPYGGTNANWLNSDNYRAGQMLAEYIISKGHKKIAFAMRPNPGLVFEHRFEGARKKCGESGLDLDIIHFSGDERNSSSPFFFEKIANTAINKYSVLIFENDILAADFIGYCSRNKLNIPKDISVAAFGGFKEFHHFHKITSIDLHPEDIGKYAVTMGLSILKEGRNTPQGEYLPVSLFEGDTVATINN